MNCWRKEISVTHLATVLATVALSELESISIDEVGAGDRRREDREDDFPFKDPEYSRIRLDGLSLDMIVKREGSSYGCSSHGTTYCIKAFSVHQPTIVLLHCGLHRSTTHDE